MTSMGASMALNTAVDKLVSEMSEVRPTILVAVPRSEGPHGRPAGVIEVSLASDEAVIRPIMEYCAAEGKPFEVGMYAWVSSMAVAEAYRRRGCASAMLAQAEGLARHWDMDWLGL